ncbi:MAG: 2-hydroxychromene-2-carboxylate isomerase [Rhodoferax sp.]|uniref:2-hydroxychromene-2-carboxylate isomerase n=1 Tax=Rhodoferax sp. TaxID=50421 RepID=UPI00262E907B|nr:2-hydroxychromene-2-carboxylate isomerase [Rhodoferax sp.]MDD2881523.1 2-hydroxychromene-2-carboxylate isomerase [Rhodoferax sp.]
MKHINCYLDFISPFAYLAFEKLPLALQDLSYRVSYKPILFAALLKHHGQLGPAEIPGKREWTYRQVLWLARQHQVDLQLPAQHPFNPLGLLRLAVACGGDGLVSRYVCESIFRHVWQGGADAADVTRLQALASQLAPQHDPNGETVKAQLRTNTGDAIEKGVFGVPTFEVDGKLFWGFDALPMLAAYVKGDAKLEDEWYASEQVARWLPLSSGGGIESGK